MQQLEHLLPSVPRCFLQLNQGNSKTEAARRKILMVHSSGIFDMQPFVDMEMKAMPHDVAWMARDEHGSSLLYQFVRNTNFFLDLGGANVSENEPEAKRQKL